MSPSVILVISPLSWFRAERAICQQYTVAAGSYKWATSGPSPLQPNVSYFRFMRIGFIGWGSLIWNPRELAIPISKKWHCDGPNLRVEFARFSGVNRQNPELGKLTLVIMEDTAIPSRQTYWARCTLSDLEAARQNLRDREGCQLDAIHWLSRTSDGHPGLIGEAQRTIKEWLLRKDLDAIVWTGLASNWRQHKQEDFSIDGAVAHLISLEGPPKSSKLEEAQEYVRKTPKQIDTEVRGRIRNRAGWEDEQLPNSLFENDCFSG